MLRFDSFGSFRCDTLGLFVFLRSHARTHVARWFVWVYTRAARPYSVCRMRARAFGFVCVLRARAHAARSVLRVFRARARVWFCAWLRAARLLHPTATPPRFLTASCLPTFSACACRRGNGCGGRYVAARAYLLPYRITTIPVISIPYYNSRCPVVTAAALFPIPHSLPPLISPRHLLPQHALPRAPVRIRLR